MKALLKVISVAVVLGVAVLAMAGDVADTMTEKKADVKKAGRNVKGALTGGKTAGDHVGDAKDSLDKGVAKTKKEARKVGRKVQKAAHSATK